MTTFDDFSEALIRIAERDSVWERTNPDSQSVPILSSVLRVLAKLSRFVS